MECKYCAIYHLVVFDIWTSTKIKFFSRFCNTLVLEKLYNNPDIINKTINIKKHTSIRMSLSSLIYSDDKTIVATIDKVWKIHIFKTRTVPFCCSILSTSLILNRTIKKCVLSFSVDRNEICTFGCQPNTKIITKT